MCYLDILLLHSSHTNKRWMLSHRGCTTHSVSSGETTCINLSMCNFQCYTRWKIIILAIQVFLPLWHKVWQGCLWSLQPMVAKCRCWGDQPGLLCCFFGRILQWQPETDLWPCNLVWKCGKRSRWRSFGSSIYHIEGKLMLYIFRQWADQDLQFPLNSAGAHPAGQECPTGGLPEGAVWH